MTPGTEARERPILMSAPMVRALLDGRKTMTRRIVKAGMPLEESSTITSRTDAPGEFLVEYWKRQERAFACPYGKPGDRLFVREGLHRPDGDPWLYRADNQPVMVDAKDETAMIVWAHHKQQDHCPSIFMPCWASRITLEITDVRVERLQEISEEDARAEGVRYHEASHVWGEGLCFPTAREAFRAQWDSLNGKRSPWSRNCYVWAISFRGLP